MRCIGRRLRHLSGNDRDLLQSHAKVLLHAGLLTKTFAADPEDLYFLVVPVTADREGSYGKDSALVERPAGTSACKPQLVGSCP